MGWSVTDVIAPVLRDMRSTGAPIPAVTTSVEYTGADEVVVWLRSNDGRAHGVYVRANDSSARAIADAANRIQEWVIEELWTRDSNWPPCPSHPGTHPLVADVAGDAAVWMCPKDHTVVAEIGAL